jgi:hypothetical protein
MSKPNFLYDILNKNNCIFRYHPIVTGFRLGYNFGQLID